MICDQPNPRSPLESLNPLSPPLTPGCRNEGPPSNFLTSYDEYINTTPISVNTSNSNNNSVDSIHPGSTQLVSGHPRDESNILKNPNIPIFLHADVSLGARPPKDEEYCHSTLLNPSSPVEHVTSVVPSYSLPSPVSSPEESEPPLTALPGVASIFFTPVSSSSLQQQQQQHHHQQQQQHNYRHHHHHHQQQQHHQHQHHSHQHQDSSHHLPNQSLFEQSGEALLTYREKDMQNNLRTGHNKISYFPVTLATNDSLNNNSNRQSTENNTEWKDSIVTTQHNSITPGTFKSTLNHSNSINSSDFQFQNENKPQRLDPVITPEDCRSLSEDCMTDIKNSSSIISNIGNSKNDKSKEADNEFPSLTTIMSTVEYDQPLQDLGNNNELFDILDRLPPISDFVMRDNDSGTEYDITNLDSPSVDELESQVTHFIDLSEYGVRDWTCHGGDRDLPTCDDISDTESKYIQHRIDPDPNFYLRDYPIPYAQDGFINAHNRPSSTNSDEGFDEPPEDSLPFRGYFGDTNLTEVKPAVAHPVKKPRKRLNSTKPRRKVEVTTSPNERERRKPGRKPGQVSNVLHLWEFIRDLLHAPKTHGEIIEWISQAEGVFRVINSAEVARLWGEKKNNKKAMTYEKLSRSLRYSRLEGYFVKLPKDKNYPKKLCFKFGPKSKDWSLS